MDLSDRLRRIKKERVRRSTIQNQDNDVALSRLQELVPGEWYRAGECKCYVTTRLYPWDHVYGHSQMDGIRQIPADLWTPWLSQDRDASLDPTQALFIDAETTGLGTGPSVYAFMLGIAYYGEDGFTVRQYMMPSPADEPALLDLLLEDMAAHPGLVSFNGRSFDWPLMRTRLMLANRLHEAGNQPHLDLLLMARRLWKNRLRSCSLGSLETQVLGIERTEQDVPGWMIPGIYEDFMDRGIVEPLAGVFYHNQLDMVSMAALATIIGGIVADPWDAPGPLHDYYAIGRLLDIVGDRDRALRAYQTSWSDESNTKALEALSTILKRQGKLDQATSLWTEALGCAGVYPCIELAKFFEHTQHDYARAIELTESALEQLDQNAPAQQREEIEHRLTRLERKAGKRQQP